MQTREWFDVNPVGPNVFAISEPHHWEKVRSHLFVGTERALLIDTGTGICNIRPIVETLTKLPVTVLTTHAHWDHYGNHHRFEDVHVHELDAGWLREGLPLPLNNIRAAVMKEPFEPSLAPDFSIHDYAPPIIASPHIFRDGAVFENGTHRMVAIHTPGHSPGGTCFHDEVTGYLATGDHLYRGTVYANYPSTDPAALISSLARLKDAGASAILPGHNDDLCSVDFLDEAVCLGMDVKAKGLDRHGTGAHTRGDLTFLF